MYDAREKLSMKKIKVGINPAIMLEKVYGST